MWLAALLFLPSMKTIALGSSPKHGVSAFADSACFLLLLGLLLCPCAPASAQQPADSQTSLSSIESIFALVPASTNLRQGSGYNPVGIKQAEEAIVTQVTGKPAVLSYKVEAVEPTKFYGFAYMIKSPVIPISVRGVNLTYQVFGLFKEDQAATVAKVLKGSTVIVSGTLDHGNIIMQDGKPLLRVDLTDARLSNNLSVATASLPKTVDTIKVADPASEAAHAQAGEDTNTGVGLDHPFRQAWTGGWFSYQVRVLPNQPTDLVLTFWGSDVGNRRFDILANGRKLGSQVLQNNQPGKFFEVRYTIPANLPPALSGSPASPAGTVTIRFQPTVPGATVGGLFGLRTEPATY